MSDHTYILVIGNPIDGLTFIGPFEVFEDAEEYANSCGELWLIADLNTPPKKQEHTKGSDCWCNPHVIHVDAE